MSEKVLMTEEDIRRTLARISHEIIERSKSLDNIVLIGMYTRGVPLAKRLAQNILTFSANVVPVGALDIMPYRDDIPYHDTPPKVTRTEVPFSVVGKSVILVDDVLYTGRSIRAAMDGIIDLGRPQSIQLIVLIDRGHRELPIEARFIGRVVQTTDIEIIEVKFQEVDSMEKVLLVEKVESAGA